MSDRTIEDVQKENSAQEHGAAFPRSGTEDNFVYQVGMTLRDWFAGQAMQAIITKNTLGLRLQGESVADQKKVSQATAHGAYFYADAMLKERKNE